MSVKKISQQTPNSPVAIVKTSGSEYFLFYFLYIYTEKMKKSYERIIHITILHQKEQSRCL